MVYVVSICLGLYSGDNFMSPVSLSYWLGGFLSLIINLHGDGIRDHVCSLCSFFLDNAQAIKLFMTYLIPI